MSLGNRSAKRHETTASQKVAGTDPSIYWDFKPGQTVMTVDGFLGRVTAVQDGPHAGNEEYDVVLHNGMGGGRYTASQLSAAVDREAARANTASIDYPELAEVLNERPDPGRYPGSTLGLTVGSLSTEAAYFTAEELRAKGQAIADMLGMSPEDVLRAQADLHEQDDRPSPGTEGKAPTMCENGHLQWGDTCPACRGTDASDNAMVVNEGDNKPQDVENIKNAALEAQAAGWGVQAHPEDYSGCQSSENNPSMCSWHKTRHLDNRGEPRADMNGSGPMKSEASAADDDEEPHRNTAAYTPIHGDYENSLHNPVFADDYNTRDGCTTCGDSGHDTEFHVDDTPAGLFTSPTGQSKRSALEFASHLITQAALDSDLGFQITAAWSDVRNKAKRIRAEGGVHITSAETGYVIAKVKGDHDTYESVLMNVPGTQKIGQWDCGCKWAQYHWGAPDDTSRFAGRMCSHALALHLEAKSRGMFGRTIKADTKVPRWLKIDASLHKEAANTEPIDRLIEHHDPAWYGHRSGDVLPSTQARVDEGMSQLTRLRDEGHTHAQHVSEGGYPAVWKPVHPSTGVVHIEDAIGDYAQRSRPQADDHESGIYSSEGRAEVYSPRVKALIELQNQGFSHARWGRDYDGDEINKWHGAMPHDGPTKYSSLTPLRVLANHLVSTGTSAVEVAETLACFGAVNSPFGEPGPNPTVKEVGPTKPRNISDNPASAGFLTAADPASWSQEQIGGLDRMAAREDDALFEPEQKEAMLHDEPEPALPSTDGAADDPEQTYSGYAGDPDPDPVEKTAMHEDDDLDEPANCDHGNGHSWREHFAQNRSEGLDSWGRPVMQPHDGHDSFSCNNHSCTEHPEALYDAYRTGTPVPQGTPGWMAHENDPDAGVRNEIDKHFHDQGMGEDAGYLLDQQPTGPSKYSSIPTGTGYAVPGDGSQNSSPVDVTGAPSNTLKGAPDDLLSPASPSIQSTGSVEDIVAEFQRTAGAQVLQGGTSGPQDDGGDIAQAAKAFLQKQAMADFSPAQQQELINEGSDVQAANLDRLQIEGTHYEALEAALSKGAANGDDDDEWLS